MYTTRYPRCGCARDPCNRAVSCNLTVLDWRPGLRSSAPAARRGCRLNSPVPSARTAWFRRHYLATQAPALDQIGLDGFEGHAFLFAPAFRDHTVVEILQTAPCLRRSIWTATLRPFSSVRNWMPVIIIPLFSRHELKPSPVVRPRSRNRLDRLDDFLFLLWCANSRSLPEYRTFLPIEGDGWPVIFSLAGSPIGGW